MRKEHKPLIILRLLRWLNRQYVNHFIVPQFDRIGNGLRVLNPRSLVIFGHDICAGNHLHLISSKLKPINITTWSSKQERGSMEFGDHCLISPGVTIASAVSIKIGKNCMIGAETYISDSDWHGIYNRTRPFRCSAPVCLKNNVWLGYRCIIGKGVTIGENSIIGAGSVVTGDIPDNVIAAGNPAKVIREINPNKKMLTREFLFSGNVDYWENQNLLDKFLFTNNSFMDWAISSFFPTRND